MNVDWRNRFGRGWITGVRHQDGTNNCWAFAATALCEAMIRIEHCLWTSRSEGDIARGTGKQPWDFGNLGEAMIFVERYGLADPGCFPWSTAASLYTAKPHGASMQATPISPTPDRCGRTLRVDRNATTGLSDVTQKKTWIDLVGPMATIVSPPVDFGWFHGDGVYVPTTTAIGGAHALLVVGFNDDDRYWVVKNSYGTSWGDGGFAKVSYDAGFLETAGFLGLRGTNPDPWSKRRLRTGVLVQSGNGLLHNNFELFVKIGPNHEHWYRENADAKMPWSKVGVVRSADQWRDTFHEDALDCPAVVQSTFNRNIEFVYRSTYRRLRHVYLDQSSGWWNDATIFGPVDPVGIPGFVQSDRGAPGDFEVVVVNQYRQAEHWTKHNGAPWTRGPGEWYQRGTFGADFAFGGPSLVHSRLGQGELHYVGTATNGAMCHYRCLTSGWTLENTFGDNVSSAPCLIEGTYGAGNETGVGNFELCVAVGDRVEHWWRHNAGAGPWNRSAVFGSQVRRVVGLLQSTYGTSLELVVERTDGAYQHYWRDGGGWHAGPVVT